MLGLVLVAFAVVHGSLPRAVYFVLNAIARVAGEGR